MSLKKNAVSYVTWMILLLFTGAACSFFGMVIANILKMNVVLITAGLIIGFFAIIFLLYLFSGQLAVKYQQLTLPTWITEKAVLIEGVAVGLLLLIGLVVRIVLLPLAGEDANYFEISKVTTDATDSLQSVQGSVYYYCMLLHGLFRITGNNWEAGIWLQIGLQMIGALLCYLAVRRLIGKIPAVLVLCFVLFSPGSAEAGITYSPQILYFCIFSASLLLVADYLRRSCEVKTYNAFMWCYTILAGIVIGVCSYIDVTGILLGLPLICSLTAGGEYHSWIMRGLRLLLAVIFARISFGICIWIDAMMCGNIVGRVMDAWKITYRASAISLDRIVQDLQVEFIILVVLACVGCVSFWRRKNIEYFTPCILMVIGMCVLIFGGFTIENMNGSYLLYILLAMFAAVSITELFQKEIQVVTVDTEDKKVVPVENVLIQEIPQKHVQVEEKTVEIKSVENKTENKVELFENPLPLPKKHVKKTLDYSFVPEKTAMKYDIYVPDNDDYDHK